MDDADKVNKAQIADKPQKMEDVDRADEAQTAQKKEDTDGLDDSGTGIANESKKTKTE